MAYTLEMHTALTNAIAQGAQRVKYGDKEVEYRTMAEMLRLKDIMEEELGIHKKADRKRYVTFDKGLWGNGVQ